MTIKELKNLGAALYACEGTKARRDYRTKNGYIYSIEFTNSDPNIIASFCLFLKKILKAEKDRIRGQLFFYPDLDEDYLKKFWSDVSGIPICQFQKSICLKQKEGKFKANQFGTFKIRYGNKKNFLLLQEMISDLWKNVKNKK